MVDGLMVGCAQKALFERYLPNDFLPALRDTYADESGWWRKLADDKEVFVAIRGAYLNAYYKGNSLIRVDLKDGKLVGSVHYKYLLRPRMKPEYVSVVDGVPQFGRDPREFFTTNLADVAALKLAADPYAGTEKTGVHAILQCNPNIIDVEAAFGGVVTKRNNPKPGQSATVVSAPRVDFVALHDGDEVVRLVFFEAKDFSNPEIRASGDTIPAVVEQICCYRDLLATNRDQVEAAYRTVFELLMAMDGRAIRNQARDAMMLAVLEGRKRLVVDTNPRVVLFGYDDAQRQAWSSHETKLRGALGPGILLMRGNPTGFTNGISANLG